MAAGDSRPRREARAYRLALHTTLAYVLISALWIYLSDRVLIALAPSLAAVERFSILKGLGFVLVTGALLWVLQRRNVARILESERAYQQRLREAEEQKRAFFQSTIAAITEGKLLIREPAEIEAMLPPEQDRAAAAAAADLSGARRCVQRAAAVLAAPERVQDLVVAAGEALTNAVKHAGAGELTLHTDGRHLWVRVSDRGAGIAELMLPRAVLERGYSTKPSLGMGYTLMLALSDRVYLATGPSGTTVVLELRCAPPETKEGRPAPARAGGGDAATAATAARWSAG